MATKKPTVRSAHDYISVNFGQGRVFTVNRGGSKGTNLSLEELKPLDDFVQHEVHKPEGNYGKAIQSLVKQIDAVWPEWNKPMPTFTQGDTVIEPTGKRGNVVGKARTNLKVQFEGDKYVTLISPAILKKG